MSGSQILAGGVAVIKVGPPPNELRHRKAAH